MLDTAMLRRIMIQCGHEQMIIDETALKIARDIWNAAIEECVTEMKGLKNQQCFDDATSLKLNNPIKRTVAEAVYDSYKQGYR